MAPSTAHPDPLPEPVAKLSKPPAEEMNEHERSTNAFIDKYSAPDVYVNGQNDTFWFPWIGPIELKPMRMDNRTGAFVVGLRSKVATSLGKHLHRGTVTAITISGQWGYEEYKWVARPGDWVCENPGVVHTLSVKDNTDIVFTITGSIEFFNDDGSLKFTMDIFSLAKMYYDHCKEKGIEPNHTLWH